MAAPLVEDFNPGFDWDSLVADLRQGKCIPFIGAGATEGILPPGAELARELAAEAHRYFRDPTNLAAVTQELAAHYRDGVRPKTRAAQRLAKRLLAHAQDGAALPKLMTLLARQARLEVYLTTNYDDLIERSLGQAGRAARSEICRWNRLLKSEDSVFDTGYRPTAADPVVFHLHGRFGYEAVPGGDPIVTGEQSMVLTENDYLDFLVNVAWDVAGASPVAGPAVLPKAIVTQMTRKTLLFIGYGLEDINFRVIMRALVNSLELANQRLNVAVQLARSSANERAALAAYLEWTLKVKVFWGNADDFYQQLSARL
ncbi:MAG TPA: SIR2 family protein [Polyangia bacterium]|nr:SIR2 family protein [Polyangia bacterium]